MAKISKLKYRLIVSVIIYLLKIVLPIIFPKVKGASKYAEVIEALVVPIYDLVFCLSSESDIEVEKEIIKYEELI